MSFLTVHDLKVRLDGFVIQGISFELAQGDYLSVLGPSGAGKSVLLDAITGFHSLDSGRIWLDGCEITDLPPERRHIGIVYQNYALFPHLSAGENIAFGLRVVEKDDSKLSRRVGEMAEALNLTGLLDKRPRSLSGGEQQRTALARALVVRPKLLLMDEPFSALDPAARRELRRLVRTLTEKESITVIHVAHDLDDTWALASQALVLEGGLTRSSGALGDVFTPPVPSFLRSAQGIRIVSGTAVERRDGVTVVDADGLRLATADAARPGDRVRLIFRPEDVTLHIEKPVGASARNVLECAPAEIYASDGTALVRLRCGTVEFNALLTVDAVRAFALPERTRVFASIKAVHLNIA